MSQRCVLCDSDAAFLPIRGNQRILLRCPRCDLIFVHEGFFLSPADEAARYRLHENTLFNEGYVNMFLDKIKIVRQHCTGIRSVLDYGCGPEPVLAKLLRKDGFKCYIYDPYFFPELPENPCDLVISTEVFEHFRDVRAELHKIRSLLVPGAYLAVMTSFHDKVQSFENWWYTSDPTHICFFSVRTFEWIAEEFGFKIVYNNFKNFIILQME